MSHVFDRRRFLECIVVTALAAGCSSRVESAPTPAQPTEKRDLFPQSVASGDPRETSVVLWTRFVDADLGEGDANLTLMVATTKDFAQVVASEKVVARAANDHTVKAKVVGLQSRTTYWYRFVYEKHGASYASPIGRTRTAPAATDPAKVAFAIACCQKYPGRYYHAWQRLLDTDPDIDAVLFIGDSVYETALDSDPAERRVFFRAPAEALDLGKGKLAARTLGNYRDLHRLHRSDPVLQQVHERWPMIITWDDHEFSDDSFGATATYSDGLRTELDVERKQNAERAFFEFSPIDLGSGEGGALDLETFARYPETKVWREFAYGANVRMMMTDTRTYRPDHLIPEDAFPPAILIDQAGLDAAGLTTTFKGGSFAYVDINDAAYAGEKFVVKEAVKKLAKDAGLTAEEANAHAEKNVKGNLSLAYVNAVLTDPSVGATPIPTEGKPRGMAWVHFGKEDLYTSRGSREIVLKETFDAWSAIQYAKTSGASEDVLGRAQESALLALMASATKWKLVISSVSIVPMVLDFRGKMDIPSSSLRNLFYVDMDGWDGFPNKRKELLAKANGSIFLGGDVHASFVNAVNGAVSVTTPAISSGTMKESTAETLVKSGYGPETAIYRYAVTELDATLTAGDTSIAYANTAAHGFTIVEFGDASASVVQHLVPGDATRLAYDQAASVRSRFVEKRFAIEGGKVRAI